MELVYYYYVAIRQTDEFVVILTFIGGMFKWFCWWMFPVAKIVFLDWKTRLTMLKDGLFTPGTIFNACFRRDLLQCIAVNIC